LTSQTARRHAIYAGANPVGQPDFDGHGYPGGETAVTPSHLPSQTVTLAVTFWFFAVFSGIPFQAAGWPIGRLLREKRNLQLPATTGNYLQLPTSKPSLFRIHAFENRQRDRPGRFQSAFRRLASDSKRFTLR
jgi:hypothetical protein